MIAQTLVVIVIPVSWASETTPPSVTGELHSQRRSRNTLKVVTSKAIHVLGRSLTSHVLI